MNETSLGSLGQENVLIFSDGYRTRADQLCQVGVPILRVADLGDGVVRAADGDRVSEDFRVKMGHKTSKAGDVLVSTKGTVGRVARVPAEFPEHVYSPQLCYLRVIDSNVIDGRWLYYWARSSDFLRQVEIYSGQTDMAPYLSLRDLASISIKVPPLDEQRRIAEALGALDDLIEVNRGLIKNLLASADVIASVIGDDVTEATFAEVCDVYGGGTPSTKDESYWSGEIRWATPTDITALPSPYLFDTSRRITTAGLDACASKLMPTGSILMTSRATIGAFAIAQEPTAVNQGFITVEPRAEVDRWFLFHEMRRRVPEFIQRANGSTFLELSRGVFKSLQVAWPSLEARTELFDRLDPLHQAAASLQSEIRELEASRDELLPLLMSGRVRAFGVAA
jgi:type I restriction enzyme S subunit